MFKKVVYKLSDFRFVKTGTRNDGTDIGFYLRGNIVVTHRVSEYWGYCDDEGYEVKVKWV